MQVGSILFAALAGALLPIQAALNAGLSRHGATPLWAGAISAAITTVALVIVAAGFWRTPLPRSSLLLAGPAWIWAGGLCGTIVLVAMLTAAPRLGAAAMIASVVAGQMLCSLMLDHFGWFGLPQQAVSLGRLLGALAICLGVALVRLF